MARHTRKKLRLLRGGSVPYLNSDELQIHNGKDLNEKMELYTIGAHGQTTMDNHFIIVPENTYFMFTAHSGTTAEGNDPGESIYVSYTNKNNREEFYDQLYTQLFKTYEERKATGLRIYPQELYIYEPGDLIPDYVLSFNNTFIFMFRHGLYKLPVEELSGKGKREYTYLGRPLQFIKRMLDEDKLKESDLSELDPQDLELLKLSDEEIEKQGKILNTRDFTKTRIYKKIEKLCCRGEDNLLIKPPFNIKEFYKNKQVIRLSTILTKLPREEKPFRFFFMNFCRISYQDIASGYYKQDLEVPKLLRTLSFSGKCVTTDKNVAFNLIRVRDIFCKFHDKIKVSMIREEPVRKLIAIMKKSIYPENGDFNFWKKCLGESYKVLKGRDRLDLIQDYLGYLNLEDIKELIDFFHFSMMANRRAYNLMIKAEKENKKIDMGYYQALKGAYAKIGLPFQTLQKQLKIRSSLVNTNYSTKVVIIRDIYRKIRDLLRPVSAPSGDYLKLISNSVEDLKYFNNLLDEDYNKDTIKDIRNSVLNSGNVNYDTELFLTRQFAIFMGRLPLTRNTEPFGIEVIKDNTISFDDITPNSEPTLLTVSPKGLNNESNTKENNSENEENVEKITNRLNELKLGGRRKTKKNRRYK